MPNFATRAAGLSDTAELESISRIEPVDDAEQMKLARETATWIEEGASLLNKREHFGGVAMEPSPIPAAPR
jgi:hypothetical protein